MGALADRGGTLVSQNWGFTRASTPGAKSLIAHYAPQTASHARVWTHATLTRDSDSLAISNVKRRPDTAARKRMSLGAAPSTTGIVGSHVIGKRAKAEDDDEEEEQGVTALSSSSSTPAYSPPPAQPAAKRQRRHAPHSHTYKTRSHTHAHARHIADAAPVTPSVALASPPLTPRRLSLGESSPCSTSFPPMPFSHPHPAHSYAGAMSTALHPVCTVLMAPTSSTVDGNGRALVYVPYFRPAGSEVAHPVLPILGPALAPVQPPMSPASLDAHSLWSSPPPPPLIVTQQSADVGVTSTSPRQTSFPYVRFPPFVQRQSSSGAQLSPLSPLLSTQGGGLLPSPTFSSPLFSSPAPPAPMLYDAGPLPPMMTAPNGFSNNGLQALREPIVEQQPAPLSLTGFSSSAPWSIAVPPSVAVAYSAEPPASFDLSAQQDGQLLSAATAPMQQPRSLVATAAAAAAASSGLASEQPQPLAPLAATAYGGVAPSTLRLPSHLFGTSAAQSWIGAPNGANETMQQGLPMPLPSPQVLEGAATLVNYSHHQTLPAA